MPAPLPASLTLFLDLGLGQFELLPHQRGQIPAELAEQLAHALLGYGIRDRHQHHRRRPGYPGRAPDR